MAEQDTNVNYLIPVDVTDPGSAAFWDKSLRLDEILHLLDLAPHAVKFVVFDACRRELQMPTKDLTKGLVPVAEQKGFFIAYSTAPGRAASDRGEGSGPYAAALAAELGHPGLDQLNLFQNVKESVIASTGGEQHPWENNGLSRRVYLTGEPTTPADMALWESVRTTSDPAALQTYLERFPTGVFAATAKQMMDRLAAEAAQRAAAAKFEVERKAQEAKQVEQLQRAVDEARQAREELSLAQEKQAKAAVAAALADREQKLLQQQRDLNAEQSEATQQSEADIAAAKSDLEAKLAAVTDELRSARERSRSRRTSSGRWKRLLRRREQLRRLHPSSGGSRPQIAKSMLAPVPKALRDGEAGEIALNMNEGVRAKYRLCWQSAVLKYRTSAASLATTRVPQIRTWQRGRGAQSTGFLHEPGSVLNLQFGLQETRTAGDWSSWLQ